MDDTLNRIVGLLDKSGMKKIEFLTKLGLSKSAWGAWMRGDTNSYLKYLPQIAEIFNVSLDWLSGNEQKNKPLVNNDEELTEYLEVLKTRPEMKMLFNLAAGATKEDVEKAVKIVEAYLKKD